MKKIARKSFKNRKNLDKHSLRTFALSSGENVTDINFTNTNINSLLIAVTFHRFFVLERLTLSNCPSLKATDFSLIACACSKTLKFIDVSKNPDLIGESFEILCGERGSSGVGCRFLECVNISDCKKFSNEVLKCLSRRAPLLKRILLDNCCLVDDEGLAILSKGCRNMREIYFNSCFKINGSCFWFFGKHLRFLLCLSFVSCFRVSDSNISGLFRGVFSLKFLSTLKKLDCSNCDSLTESTLAKIVSEMYYLTSLNVTGCSKMTHTSLQAVCQRWSHLELAENYFGIKAKQNAKAERAKELTCRVTQRAVSVLQRSCAEFLSRIKVHANNHAEHDFIPEVNLVQLAVLNRPSKLQNTQSTVEDNFTLVENETAQNESREDALETVNWSWKNVQFLWKMKILLKSIKSLNDWNLKLMKLIHSSAVKIQNNFICFRHRRKNLMKSFAVGCQKIMKQKNLRILLRAMRKVKFKIRLQEVMNLRTLATFVDSFIQQVVEIAFLNGTKLIKTEKTLVMKKHRKLSVIKLQSLVRRWRVKSWKKIKAEQKLAQVRLMRDDEQEKAVLRSRVKRKLRKAEAKKSAIMNDWYEASNHPELQFFSPSLGETVKRHPFLIDEAIVGTYVRMCLQEIWMQGFIISYNKASAKHNVSLEDGCETSINLHSPKLTVMIYSTTLKMWKTLVQMQKDLSLK